MITTRRGTPLESALSDDWKEMIGQGPLGYGFDPATTTKKTSNPSAFAAVEKVGLDYVVRCAARWKTDNPEVTRAMLRRTLDLPHGRRPRRLCVGATSERFFARDLKTEFAGRVIVELVIESETITYLGVDMSTKVYLGNLLVNAANDAHLLLPSAPWLAKDLRQPEGGTFNAEVDESGNHGDCFVAIALAIHALTRGGGPAVALPVATSAITGFGGAGRAGVHGPVGQPIGAVPRATVHV